MIERQKAEAADLIGEGEPKNLEEQALSLIGRDVFEKLDQGLHREAVGPQLHRAACDASSSAFPCASPTTTTTSTTAGRASPWAATPAMVERMLGDVEMRCCPPNTREFREQNPGIADRTISLRPHRRVLSTSGSGTLEYRSLRFESETRRVRELAG